MVKLHYSNRLENLIDPLAESVRGHQSRDPVIPISIIVPNRAIEQFVKYRLAERFGVAANLKFLFLRNFLRQLVERADPDIRVLESDGLAALFFTRLPADAEAARRVFGPVAAYVDAAGADPTLRELRRYRLANRLAQLMREYSIARGAMLAGWPRRASVKVEPWADGETWQRELWGLVFDSRRAVRAELLRDTGKKWMLLPHALEAVSRDALKAAIGGEVHLFALSDAGPAYVKIFSDLARLGEIHVYALNPCLEFWEDLETASAADRARMVSRRERVEDPFSDNPDLFHLLNDGENRALKFWGRPGREYIRLLNQLAECDFDARFVRPASRPNPSLLESLQDDILNRAPSRAAGSAIAGRFTDDRSIRILACPGIRREAEIVANAIWGVLRDGAGAAPVRFHEIAVLIPEAPLDAYLPHLESVFGRMNRIPFEIADRRFVRRSRVVEAVELLLALPIGRFTRGEVVRLLTHPALVGGEPELEIDRWFSWCAEAGVVFGADRDHLRGTYLDGDLYHWDQALRRMALGVFMTGERSGDEEPVTTRHGRYLPLELGQDAGASVMRLLRSARELIADAIALAEARLTPPEWAQALTAYVSRYVKADEPDEAHVRGWCLEAIAEMASDAFRTEAVGYRIAREVAASAIGSAQSAHGQIRGGGVAVGAMDALRSLPFRAVFVMGLGEAVFPARERRDPLDLRLARRSAGDVRTSERDRYLFLEAILAARERIFFSYVSRNPQTGEILEPSAVLRELEFILRDYLDAAAHNQLTINHPVSRFDLKYFPELTGDRPSEAHPELASLDSDALRGAKMAELRERIATHAGTIPLPGRDHPLIEYLPPAVHPAVRAAVGLPEVPAAVAPADAEASEVAISLAALRRYLECPLQGAAQYALGLDDDRDDDHDFAEDEPLEQSQLDRVMMLREVFEQASDIRDSRLEDAWRKRFELGAMHGRAPTAVFADAAHNSGRAILEQWYRQAQEAGAGDPTQFSLVRMGGADEFARAAQTLDPLILDVPVTGPDNRRSKRKVRLYGTLGLLHRRGADGPFDMGMLAVVRDEATASDFARLALAVAVLAASEQQLETRFNAVVVTASGKDAQEASIRAVASPSRDEARSYLICLASDLLSQGNNYFLPIEAIGQAHLAAHEGATDDALAEAVEAVRENQPAATDYGPVRDARARFEAPPAHRIREILKSRYEPIGWIFPEPKPARRRGSS